MNIFLDDTRSPRNVTWVDLPLVEWTIVRNYDDFVRIISSLGPPKRVSLDHDLHPAHYPFAPENQEAYKNGIPYDKYKEKTGYHCAKWLVAYCIDRGFPFPEYYVHSMNPIGRENIIKYIESNIIS